ncbi:hypothetical protein C922_05719 [Plasmodium inui San Antonio 1]|uniref:Uncharacterized protein n=1 Tax=Plasmodium inui San Antonio 1 TaxID=1237626 RepID=W7A482_9APIC|nr:hypothetical protein C922_05719 [Plasmodium inui San Antonio 1]EUD63899.1 hypothetical protein C922_05719 [Plasmodium inui San Antonio 1]
MLLYGEEYLIRTIHPYNSPYSANLFIQNGSLLYLILNSCSDTFNSSINTIIRSSSDLRTQYQEWYIL